jgi:medium-chain acyl-[acyl-carrier-protein] hydrolase
MEWPRFEKKYKVHVYETGPDGRASLYTMLNYLQDIASEHAAALGFGRDDLSRNNHFWVLSRLYVEFSYWPLWAEEILVRTLPNGIDKLFAMRNYEVLAADGKKIADGISSWLIVDMSTKKVQRPDQEHERFKTPFDPAQSPARPADKLPAVDPEKVRLSHAKVRISDLDVNLHTNNVNYVRWICDTYDLDFTMNHSPVSIEINYLAESVVGNEITVRTSETLPGQTFLHSILRNDDGKELCRVKIVWKRN